jgi:hypothetical protein
MPPPEAHKPRCSSGGSPRAPNTRGIGPISRSSGRRFPQEPRVRVASIAGCVRIWIQWV